MSEKIRKLIKELYKDTKAAVRVEGELTDWFDVTTGLRQYCLLSPILFNIYFDYVLKQALEGVTEGIEIAYEMPDGRKVRGTKVQGREKILVLLYADDLVLICENWETLDMAMTRIEEYTQQWGLTVNVRKTKRMVNKETKIEQEVDIMIRGESE